MVETILEMGNFLKTVLDAIPSPIFVVDDDVRIMAANEAACQMLAIKPPLMMRKRAGEALNCIHNGESIDGCGRGESCRQCIVRGSVYQAIDGHQIVRRKASIELVTAEGVSNIYLLVTAAPLEYQGEKLVVLVLEDISDLMELKAILPICANCKKIRNEDEYWESVENYFKEHLDVDFSHGLCPECARKLFPSSFKL
jgi:PAS domain-containing protein